MIAISKLSATLAFILIILAPAKTMNDKGWLKQLPACPCTDPDLNGVVVGDGWAKDKGDLYKYHRGAASSYRSYPAVKTIYGYSCQQCCYDKKGALITAGRGAGTPDKKSACSGEDKNGRMKVAFFGAIAYYFKDVRPWVKMMRLDSLSGWKHYNETWIPDNSNGCPINVVPLEK